MYEGAEIITSLGEKRNKFAKAKNKKKKQNEANIEDVKWIWSKKGNKRPNKRR